MLAVYVSSRFDRPLYLAPSVTTFKTAADMRRSQKDRSRAGPHYADGGARKRVPLSLLSVRAALGRMTAMKMRHDKTTAAADGRVFQRDLVALIPQLRAFARSLWRA